MEAGMLAGCKRCRRDAGGGGDAGGVQGDRGRDAGGTPELQEGCGMIKAGVQEGCRRMEAGV